MYVPSIRMINITVLFFHFFLIFAVKKLFSGNCATSLQQLSPSGYDAGSSIFTSYSDGYNQDCRQKWGRGIRINRFSPWESTQVHEIDICHLRDEEEQRREKENE